MEIEYWPTDKPRDYPKNARKWTGKAIEKVAASIHEYGFRQPIVVDREGVIVIGHLRRAAARHLGIEQVPVHIAIDLTPAQIRGLRLADNRTNQESDWDVDLLAAEFAELKGMDFDLSLTGFDGREIENFTMESNPVEDEVPAIREAPVSRLGDLWVCGSHRVLCGDSTAADAVSRLLSAVLPPCLMVTDPPYGVEYDPEWRNKAFGEANRAIGRVTNDDQCRWDAAISHFPGDVLYLWHAGNKAGETADMLHACGFDIRVQIIWVKQHFVIGRGHYHGGHEPCWYAVRRGRRSNWRGDRSQSTAWHVNNGLSQGGPRKSEDGMTGHSTQKPVELMRRPILNHTVPGEAVYDPFLGSGTTMIAAEATARICYGIEIDPAYTDVIVQRWQNLTGKIATLEGSGATFEHVKFGRQQAQDAIAEEAFS